MRRYLVVTRGLLIVLMAAAALNARATRGAAQATNTPEPIVIEFATSTPTDAGKDGAAEPTNTPRVFQIATLPPSPEPAPTERVGQVPPTPTATGEEETREFEAADWVGGFYQGDPDLQAYYGRPWVAVYGAQSDYPRATLAFRLDDKPEQAVTVVILGLDDELEALNQIAVEINGSRVYQDEAFFANWNAVSGDPSVWTEVRLTIDPSLLQEGVNTLTFLNLEPAASFNGPPYFLLGAGSISAGGVEVEIASPDQSALAAGGESDDDNRGNSEENRQDDKEKQDKDKNGKGNDRDDENEEDDDDDG